MMRKSFWFISCLIFPLFIFAQAETTPIVIDQVTAVVGQKMIKLSDIENQINSIKIQEGYSEMTEDMRCRIFERMLINKLYENQAEIDSIFISENDVEVELDRRIRYFIARFGSKEKLEEFYKKSILEIKAEYHDIVKEQKIAEKMQASIISDVKVVPMDVKAYYNKLSKDSIPFVETEYEIGQIVIEPKISMASKEQVKKQLEVYRARIVNGERFATLAALYSEDPGSRVKGGDLGTFGRGDMTPEFEAMAYNTPVNETSPVFETPFGYHILQVISRQGDNINARHILLTAKPSPEDMVATQKLLDSVADLIRKDSISFDKAVVFYSDAKEKEGYYTSPQTGNIRMTTTEMDPYVFAIIDKMEVGEVSNSTPMFTSDRKQAFRILYLKERTAPHLANLQTDYDKIYQMALQQAKENKMQEWLLKKIHDTYVVMYGNYKNCKLQYDWTK